MRAYIHPLVERMRIAADPGDDVPLILPFAIDEAFSGTAGLGSWATMLLRDDEASIAAARASNQSFAAALKSGLQVPGELLEGLLIRRAIWRFRHEAASASGTLVVTRVAEPCLEYLALATAPADDLKGWLAVDSGAPGDLAVQFPLWRHVDSPVPVVSIATIDGKVAA